MRVGDWFPIAAAIFAVRFIAGEAVFEHASRRGDAIVFRPVLGLRLLFGAGIPFCLYATPQVVKEGNPWLAPISLGGAIVIFLFWPGTILVDSTSIRETRWFGVRRISIAWGEVQFAGDDLENSVTVRTKDDRVIQHTRYHVDRRGFIEALKQYCANCAYNDPGPKPKPWVPLGSL